jgi:hypothetical protein
MPSIRTRRTACLAVLAAVWAVGCFGPPALKYDMLPVDGAVTFEGEPLVAAEVMLDSADGPRGFGTTDEAGRFTVTTRQFGAGLPAGTYRVLITGSEKTRLATSGRPVKVPNRYRESGAGKVVIAAGSAPLRFDLTKSSGATARDAGESSEL